MSSTIEILKRAGFCRLFLHDKFEPLFPSALPTFSIQQSNELVTLTEPG